MIIKILGSGCKSCMSLYEMFEKNTNNIKDVEVIKITDFKGIMKYRVMSMPAIVIDEKVIMQGKIPNEKQVIVIISNNRKTDV